ncbi:hypothetical protein N9324_00180 [Candidatus Pelagibacter sp.]|nr:hypothetical protein [Candidatus Pelagibacter sp.]
MSKNKDIPQWQKSVFDNSVDKTSCVKTKPISSSIIKKIEKDFFDQNHQKMEIINPELFEDYKQEFGIKKNKSKIIKNGIKRSNTKKINNNGNIKKIVVRDEADEKLSYTKRIIVRDEADLKISDTKIIEGKDLKEKDQSNPLNQNKTNSDDELSNYLEQKKIEQSLKIEQLRKEEQDPLTNFKFNKVKKDLNCGMGFVNPHSTIHQNKLGHSQSWRFKKQKKYQYYD